MRIRLIIVLMFATIFTGVAQENKKEDKKVRLVISINVDQMRSDFLYEFEGLYTDNGFKRLMSGGRVYSNSYYAFEQIDRASATATLMTGTNPYVSGIVGERWLDRGSLRLVGCTDDSRHKGLYTNDAVSPAKLKSLTITDELKRATRGKAQVCAIAPDCDAAVMSGGHAADVVLWKNDDTGYWCSSSYYGQFPQWAADMNKKVVGRSADWKPFFPTEMYLNYGEKAPKAFNYSFNGSSDVRSYKTSACINNEMTEMAIACLRSGNMGLDDITDFLSVTYYAGNFNSLPMEDRPIEIQDIYTRLDLDIAALLDEVDSRIGLENVLVTLASTGYIVEGEDNEERYNLPSGYIHLDRVSALLNVYLSAIFGKAQYVEGYHNSQLYMNRRMIETLKLDKLDVISHAVEFLKSIEGVEDVFTIYRLGGLLSPEMQYVKNGYNANCSGDIWLRLMPGWKMAKDIASASNLVRRSSVFFPMIMFGGGVKQGVVETMTPAGIMAPEIARILRIRRPNDNCLRMFQ
ncbi:MAG: alkaline phosphatase family protein [Bacteroidaceae bacterium]|nr:alkaline phosphatase family protein [Bacteroidaceae bacterium]